MSAVAIVGGVLEGLQLIETLAGMMQQASAAITAAQAAGTPVDFTGILGEEDTAEAAALAAIAAAKAAGK
jgi:hypothetical protein